MQWAQIPDEAWYASSANSFFETFEFLMGGRFNSHALPLYSVFISPAYFFHSMTEVFTAIKFINSVAMTSAMFPVFLLARKFLPFGRAFIVSLLSVIIGPMFYTFTIMAESLHYPLIIWLFYLMFLSVTRYQTWRIDMILGMMFALACLNKMSSLAIVVSYIFLIFVIDREHGAIRGLKRLPITIFRALWRHKYVFILCAATLAPYLFYRSTNIESPSALPYDYLWRTFIGNIRDFDVLKYIKWWFIYFGQLNLSTGLFLLPLSLLMAVQLIKKGQKEEMAFGYLSIIVMVCVLSLAVLQSGYNLARLTERHFFVLTPLIFILALQSPMARRERSSWLLWGALGITVLFATYAALFLDSVTAGPACDSAFFDFMQFLKARGVSQSVVSVIILCLSAVFIFIAGVRSKRWFIPGTVAWLSIFLISLTISVYSLSYKHLKRLKSERGPLVEWLGDRIHSPANIVLVNLPRYIATDYILWNRDYMSNLLWQGRKRLENPAEFKFCDFLKIERVLDKKKPTYIISPALKVSGATFVETRFGCDLYKKNESEEIASTGFFVDVGQAYTVPFLTKGWRGNEGPYPGGWPTFSWAFGSGAEMEVYVGSVDFDKALSLRVKSFFQGQSIHIQINGKRISTIDLQPEWNEYVIPVPASYFRVGKNAISFKFKYPKDPSTLPGNDPQNLAVAFDWLKLEDCGS